MSKISNQDIERYYFEKFRKVYPLPSGKIDYGNSPDVIIEGERRIGMEITRFYLKKGSLIDSRQVQKKIRDEVVSKAQQVYLKNKGKKFEISFGFDDAHPIREKKSLVDKLADLAKCIERFEAGEIDKDFFKTIPELSFVYLNNEVYENARWRVVQVYDVPIYSVSVQSGQNINIKGVS
jgi:hypothetical protein